MVQITSILLALVLSCPIGVIHAAPVNNTVNSDTLLKNGHTAQHLNTKFKDLSINDQCTNGQEACISGALAKCDNAGKWEAEQCPSNSQCFVLPDVRSEGSKLRCVSEQQASSLIQASGAQGGVFGDNSTDSSNSSDSSSGTATITVLVAPSTTQTLGAQTTTLDNAGASSLLASLESGGATISSGAEPTELNTAASTSATATSSGDGVTATDDSATASISNESAGATSASAVNGAQGALATGLQGAVGAAAPTTIILTTGSSTATASSDPSATPDAAVASASASAPPSPPPSYGGY